MHDEGAGGQVAEPLIALVADHRDHAGKVEARHVVDEAQKIASQGLKQGDLAAGVLDDADLHHAFSWGLAVPESLEKGKVAPNDEENNENESGDEPFAAELVFRVFAGRGHHGNEDQQQDKQRAKLENVVEQKRHKAAAEAGYGELQRDLFRGLDAKLVGITAPLKAAAHDHQSLDRTKEE